MSRMLFVSALLETVYSGICGSLGIIELKLFRAVLNVSYFFRKAAEDFNPPEREAAIS